MEGNVCKLKDSELKVKGNYMFLALILQTVNIMPDTNSGANIWFNTFCKVPKKSYIDIMMVLAHENSYKSFYELAGQYAIKLEENFDYINTIELRKYIVEKSLKATISKGNIYSLNGFDFMTNEKISEKYQDCEITYKVLNYFDNQLLPKLFGMLCDIIIYNKTLSTNLKITNATYTALFSDIDTDIRKCKFEEKLTEWLHFNDLERYITFDTDNEDYTLLNLRCLGL